MVKVKSKGTEGEDLMVLGKKKVNEGDGAKVLKMTNNKTNGATTDPIQKAKKRRNRGKKGKVNGTEEPKNEDVKKPAQEPKAADLKDVVKLEDNNTAANTKKRNKKRRNKSAKEGKTEESKEGDTEAGKGKENEPQNETNSKDEEEKQTPMNKEEEGKTKNKNKTKLQNETNTYDEKEKQTPMNKEEEGKTKNENEKIKPRPQNETKSQNQDQDKAENGEEEKDESKQRKRKRNKKNKRKNEEDKEEGSPAKKMKVEGEDKEEEAKGKKTKKQEKQHVLFIGNLPYDVTEEEIRQHFKAVGDNIVRVTLMVRNNDSKGKGYGFIQLKDAAAYNNALKLHLSQLKNRKINVEFTTPGNKSDKKRKNLIKMKTQKLLGQGKKKGKKENKKKKGGPRRH